MGEGDRLRGLHVGIARHHRVEILSGKLEVGAAKRNEHFRKLQIDLAGVDADFRREKVVARAGRVLLTADLKASHLDEVALKVEVEVFDIRINLECRVILFAFDLGCGGKKLLLNVFGDDAGLGKHQNVRLVDVENRVVGALEIAFNRRTNEVLDDFFGRGLLDFSALHGLSHFPSPCPMGLAVAMKGLSFLRLS